MVTDAEISAAARSIVENANPAGIPPALADPKAEMRRCIKRDGEVRRLFTRVLVELRKDDPELQSPLATAVREMVTELVYVRNFD